MLLADMDVAVAALEPFAVVVLGLDRFKAINDATGNAAGDRLLVQLAHRLQDDAGAWRPYRVGGDEFALLSTAAMPAETEIDHLLARLAAPLRAGTIEVTLPASAGIVSHPADGRTSDELLRRVDLALSSAKRNRRGGAVKFSTLLEAEAVQRLQIEQSLRAALDSDALELHYQPKARTRTRSLAGVEALLRWNHPDLGMVPPDRFLPIAVDCGLMTRIDQWVIRRAVRDAVRLVDAGLPGRVAINLSAECLASMQVVDWLAAALQAQRLAAGAIEVEITEGSLMQDLKASRATLDAIRALGVRIGVDDFGTGYSSLAYLTQFPIDVLKVDRQFVSRMMEDERARKVVRGVIGLAHSLGMRVVAEGVETAQQIHALEALDCDFIQGWAFGKPMPLEAMVQRARREHARTQPPKSDSVGAGGLLHVDDQREGLQSCTETPPDARSVTGPRGLLDAIAEALAQVDRMAAMPQAAALGHALERVEQAVRTLRTALERASHDSALLGAALDRMDQGLMMVDAQRVVQVCNRRARELLELPADLMESRPRFEQVLQWQWARDEFVHTPDHLKDFVRAGGILDTAHRYDRQRPDGRVIEVQSVPIPGGGVLRTYSDITERKRHDERIEWLARHDGLTGLVNRTAFIAAAEAAIARARTGGNARDGQDAFAICYVNLDRFQQINHRRGYAAGDAVLTQVAERMQRIVREADVVARLGGDEFALLLAGVSDGAEASAFARRLVDAIGAPIRLEGGPVKISASSGVALYPSDGADVETMLHAADAARCSAKAARRPGDRRRRST